ncbi:MAG: hypothetical protein KJ559_01260, partial [Nanoarchaeota archaeon]|nr:hypothetical protein [Nanoarchaeota archaeon]
LLKRNEVKLKVEQLVNPSYEEAVKLIEENFKAEKDNIVIKFIKGQFGTSSFVISAFIYKTKEDKEIFEPKKKEKKEGGEQKTVIQEVKAEEKKEDVEGEKPVEKKEEAVEEKKEQE